MVNRRVLSAVRFKPLPCSSGTWKEGCAIMHWFYLGVATVFEIGFALCANAAKGFTRLWWSVATLIVGGVATYFLSLALITLDVGVGYAIWTGLGSVGIVLLGIVLFKERLDWRKLLSIGVVVAGVVGLQLSGAGS